VRRRRRLSLGALVLVLVGVLGATGYGVLGAVVRHRVLDLPTPAGPAPVGRTIFQWTDLARTDGLAPNRNEPRRLAVWVWYPAASVGDRPRAPYLPGPWAGMRSNVFADHLLQDPDRVRGHATAGAPVAPGPVPVLVLLPGLGLSAPDFSTVAEDLASRGYAVVGVTPTYSANGTVLDGRVVSATDAGKEPGDALARVWAADASFALDRIGREPGFATALDRHRVGFFGHSFGGASSVEGCRRDTRCVAAADVDGQPYGEVTRTGTDRPLLLVGRADLCTSPACADMPGLSGMLAAGRGPSTLYRVRGALHFNFTDLALFHVTPPLRRLLPLGPIDPAAALRIETDLLDAFFSTAFGGPDELAQTAHRHPEVVPVTAG
jgi:dienelactone hydrolase